MPIEIIRDLALSPTPERFSAALAHLKQLPRFSNLADWEHWEHLDFIDAMGTIWICPLPDGCFCGTISYPHPGWGKYDPRLLILIEKLAYYIRLKERCLASVMATLVDQTLDQVEYLVHVVEEACDANGLNIMIRDVKSEVCIYVTTLDQVLISLLFY